MQNFAHLSHNSGTAQQENDHSVISHHPKAFAPINSSTKARSPTPASAFSQHHNHYITDPFRTQQNFYFVAFGMQKTKRPERTKTNVLLSFAEPLNVALLPLSLPR